MIIRLETVLGKLLLRSKSVAPQDRLQGQIRSALQSPRGARFEAPRVARLAGGAINSVEANVQPQENKEVLSGAFFWLTMFYLVYCARPGDVIPGVSIVPLAKISGVMTALSFLLSMGKTPRGLKDLPKEAYYLMLMVILLFVSAVLSPVWRGGAVNIVMDFSKVLVAWLMTFLLVTSLRRLRRIIFVQSASVAIICCVAIVKGASVPRLQDVIGGTYSNPNDMSFAIVLSLPFCLTFLLLAKNWLRKMAWGVGILAMMAALFLTQSRGGFINLVITGAVLLWQFGVKGKRTYLIAGAVIVSAALFLVAGKGLEVRLNGLFSSGEQNSEQDSAHASYEERRQLMIKAKDAIIRYPLFGVGAGDFEVYSGIWREVHMEYLQIAVEGGIPVLILYLLFFGRGFANLRALGKTQNLDNETVLFVGALRSSLVGFVVGACFAPEAYQYFPYFAVCYTSVFFAITQERAHSQLPAASLLKSSLRFSPRMS